MDSKIRIVIPIYPGVTHLDFTGPHQFFSRVPQIDVVVASTDGEPVDVQGLTFSNLDDLTDIAACDVLCVPGGLGCLDAAEDIRFINAIRHLAGTAQFVTSVCTGSLILGAAGLTLPPGAIPGRALRHTSLALMIPPTIYNALRHMLLRVI
ncbi:DJ-1/PfpI family protein [Chromohalobacter marismortui]|uniref:DJ-1/PfpI family protein n=1 Tax=Chromohalobacter marismortui TaxID=42055 RepID=A0A4R7NFT3_9GAMM|nr:MULTISPECIES: DJ-1/PfpI family protein [Chromohalobacter]MCI0510976.1 DJ-1/PfpI family protein [Chromohalobacter sp.]MCI0593252.1 DJ-1/PfpI family protein [Chromohalobacter sp.]TDU19232.1 DJ-1/PfpI family protein [Chromohalobacter marismortui]